ncbi:MAG: glycosyltransferase family 2 protein [Atopobiaceae bacterium]
MQEGTDAVWTLNGPGSFDFTTFFNALSVQKYDRYTVAQAYRLHLEVKGAACKVMQTCADSYDYYSRVQKDDAQSVAGDNQWHEVDLTLSYEPSDAICGFAIEAEGPVQLRNAYYVAEVPEDAIRDVELALSTTTFKKEKFIQHNIDLVRQKILGSDDPIAKHFRMFVIDNGRTLDSKGLSGDGVTVFPNNNVGGSGGFAYGMVKALEAGDVTNILLMDDDVEVSPESIKRTYQLLTILNEEYSQAFVSGAMMNFDEPDIHWDDIGYMTEAGIYRSYKPVLRMSVLHDCVTCETFNPDTDAFADLQQRYAAWWYCCIPISVIKKNGMPLPFFVRFDDAEYGLRCKPKFITLNGICIWHLAFFMRYNAGVERYQTMRNGLIGQAITHVAPLTNFEKELRRNVMMELVKFNYKDAELVCDGIEDFLKGPSFFMAKGVAEQTFMAANRNKEKLLPLDQIREQAQKELGIDVYALSNDEIVRDFPLGKTMHGKVFNVYHTQLFERSLNGQLFGDLKSFDGDAQVIEAVGWSYQPGKLYGVDTVLAINVQNKVGIIRHRDNERGKAIWHRFITDMKRYHENKAQLEADYAACRDRITSVEYWKDYLGI